MLAQLAMSAALAATTPSEDIGLDVKSICQYVAENLSDTNPNPLTPYVYRTRLFRAAGVDPAMDDYVTIRMKMQTYWNRHRAELVCNVPNSVVRNGNILKLAVDRSSSAFLTDVVRRWQLDLNQIDRDGETVLDFTEKQLEGAAGSPREATLRRYRNLLLAGGARRARDLSAR
jgi:hypothetical protein